MTFVVGQFIIYFENETKPTKTMQDFAECG